MGLRISKLKMSRISNSGRLAISERRLAVE